MQVPYNPIPDKTSALGTPGVSINSAGAFGEGVAQALGHAGQTLGHAGDELFQRAVALQQLRNETEAKEADAKYMVQVGQMHAEYSALEGKAAVDAYPAYVKNIQNLRDQMRADLSNDQSRKMYDTNSLGTMGRTIFNGAGHAATENKRYAVGASGARIAAVTDQAGTFPKDDIGFQRSIGLVRAEIESQGDLKGWSPEQTQEESNKAESRLWAQRITGLSRTDPYRAQEMLGLHREQLRTADADAVDKTVMTQLRTTGARMISQEVNADLNSPDSDTKVERPLAERIREGRAKAEKLAPDDKLLPDFVEQRIMADYSKHKQVIRDFEDRNKAVLDQAMVGGSTGQVPTTLEQLKGMNPKVAAAWDALPEAKQKSYMRGLAQNAMIPDLERKRYDASDEGLRRYQQLKGMASPHGNPAEFADLDLTNEKFSAPKRSALIDLQTKIKAKANDDPRVTRAIERLRASSGADMEALGIYRRKKGQEEDYDRFVGALQDALDVWQESNKRPPNAKEVDEIGARIMQQRKVPGRWWGTNTEPPMFQQEPPEDFAEGIKKKVLDAGGTEPTTEQIRRAYQRAQLLKHYGKPTNE